VVPARIHGEDVGLPFATRAGSAGPAAQLDIAGVVKLGLVVTDHCLSPQFDLIELAI
jgi:hypothetical protein